MRFLKNIGAKEGIGIRIAPHRLDEHGAGSLRSLRYWSSGGKLDIEDLRHIPIPDEALGMDVVVHVVGTA